MSSYLPKFPRFWWASHEWGRTKGVRIRWSGAASRTRLLTDWPIEGRKSKHDREIETKWILGQNYRLYTPIFATCQKSTKLIEWQFRSLSIDFRCFRVSFELFYQELRSQSVVRNWWTHWIALPNSIFSWIVQNFKTRLSSGFIHIFTSLRLAILQFIIIPFIVFRFTISKYVIIFFRRILIEVERSLPSGSSRSPRMRLEYWTDHSKMKAITTGTWRRMRPGKSSRNLGNSLVSIFSFKIRWMVYITHTHTHVLQSLISKFL